MRLFRPVFFSGWLYPEAVFRIRTNEKVLYLTFDDGPDPVSTPRLLNILKTFDIKALFFCDGRAAEKFPDLINQIRSQGHQIGNHGYSHFDGWHTESDKYINDITRASEFTSGKIFRPPYGRLSVMQKKRLLKSYKIIFWDLMPYDFDISFGSGKSIRILKNKIRPGSIIVLHDTPSSCANMILEEFIKYALSEGYRFDMIDDIF
jgi:peptidoglycan/xylan/chitin deacetylase (PgdA/CDA1 family)